MNLMVCSIIYTAIVEDLGPPLIIRFITQSNITWILYGCAIGAAKYLSLNQDANQIQWLGFDCRRLPC
jgi:hypothetical protein